MYLPVLFAPWEIFPPFLSSADFFQNRLLKKLFQEYYQSVKQLRSRSGLIWVQTVCKGYQQKTLGGKEFSIFFEF